MSAGSSSTTPGSSGHSLSGQNRQQSLSRTPVLAGEGHHTSAARPQPVKRAASMRESESDEYRNECCATASLSCSHCRTPSSIEKNDRTLLADSGSSDDEPRPTTLSCRRENSYAEGDRKQTSCTAVSTNLNTVKCGHTSVTKDHRHVTPHPGTKTAVRFADLAADVPSSESDGELDLPLSQNKRYLKPPTYNGSTNFETFYARFENCSTITNRTRPVTDRRSHAGHTATEDYSRGSDR